VAVHVSGVAVVADSANRRLRRVDSSGLVSALAGSGSATWADGTGTSASFSSPAGLAMAAVDDALVYVADSNNHRIRAVGFYNGSVTTLAGAGVASFLDGAALAAYFYTPLACAVTALPIERGGTKPTGTPRGARGRP
jgi:sugar lactone lactonase YvrE